MVNHWTGLEKKLKGMEMKTAGNHGGMDVRESVMERVTEGTTFRRISQRTRMPAVTAMSLLVILSLSAGVYAAIEMLQIKGAKGDVLIETRLKEEGAENEKIALLQRLAAPYWSIAERSVQPGENIAYYIRDKKVNDLKREIYGKSNLLEFQSGSLSIGSHSAYRIEADRRGLSAVPSPMRLLNDYSFKEGALSGINLQELFNREGPTPAYYAIQNELVQMAAASPGKQILIKELPSSSFNQSSVLYVNGKNSTDTITVIAVMRGGIEKKQELAHSARDQVEKTVIKGRELLYIRYGEGPSRHAVRWVEEDSQLEYVILGSWNSSLAKDDMLNAAGQFMP